MTYRKFFDKDKPDSSATPKAPVHSAQQSLDNRIPYLVSEAIEQAVNVALATGRPLLVKGEPGSGKTALARHLARYFDWGFEAFVVKSDTTVQDLEWRYDSVRRLNDAFASRLSKSSGSAAASSPDRVAEGAESGSLSAYIEPGPLWRAFTREAPRLPALVPPDAGAAASSPPAIPERVLLLIDEIDKADPDVPNGLLDALGNLRFRVTELDRQIEAEVSPFVLLTSNDERELPGPFLRRCIVLLLPAPDPQRLSAIAKLHNPDVETSLVASLNLQFEQYRKQADKSGLRRPGTAEFLDAVQACQTLKVGPTHPLWPSVLQLTLWKHAEPPPSLATGASSARVS